LGDKKKKIPPLPKEMPREFTDLVKGFPGALELSDPSRLTALKAWWNITNNGTTATQIQAAAKTYSESQEQHVPLPQWLVRGLYKVAHG
jgi:hypothetical protein